MLVALKSGKSSLVFVHSFEYNDSDHGETMSCDSPPALWRWHTAALHHSGGAGGGGLVKVRKGREN